MKILYDSHVLISAFLKQHSIDKTGVYRFAEQMAMHLEAFDDVQVSFFSSLTVKSRLLWEQQVKKNPQFSSVTNQNFYSPVQERLDKLSHKIKQSSSWKKGFMKSYREVLRFMANRSTENEKQLQGFDLYYSPYHPCPKWLKQHQQLPSVHTIHDLIPLKYPKFFQVNKKSFFDRMMKKVGSNQYFFALSESTKADMCYYYSIDPSKIFVVHSAPRDDLFFPVKDAQLIQQVRSKYQIDGPYLLSLATLEPRKNIPFLVDAFIELINQQPHLDLKLVLAGAKGWGFDALMKKIERYKKHILVTGFIADEDLAPLYSDALAFIYPSLYEGFGLPPLEAMRCAAPVIASKRSSLPEVVGSAGLYMDPTRKDEIQKCILQVYENESLRLELSKKSLEQSAKFTWEKNALEAQKAFKSILS